MKYSWTQALCWRCWDRRFPDHPPNVLPEEHIEVERCADCGRLTRSGIYLRCDPRTVRYPTITSR